ncbi:hypothetical protein [Paenibacillus mendelii]|uniref:Uncharacterized protein n=1 Tax=Paenibacillus mendelii TaxID=206163 RepID=A0ABV6JD42_9BACL|nr:hypothetical protein [Paenibacillus mendelii]MCQ6562569.1 hypothetical protein [Paenibacillus mendelii]
MSGKWRWMLRVCLCTGVMLAGMQGGGASAAGDAATTDSDLRSQQTDLSILWIVQQSAVNKMTTAIKKDAALSKMVGQAAYIPLKKEKGRNPLYRLYNGSSDHMDSMNVNEGKYSKEAVLGYPWNAAAKPAGTTALIRGFHSTNGDYALMSDYLKFPGYKVEVLKNAYGYPRFGSKVPLIELQGSKVKVKSNLAAGGAVWELWWNGKQMIDHLDYGREIQSSMSFTNATALPTEGGDGTADPDKSNMHGSPIAFWGNKVTPNFKKQSTRAVPLEWNFEHYNGGLPDVPVIYKDWKLGKDLYLDDKSIDLGSSYNYLRGQVIRYETVLQIPRTLNSTNIEIPTAYLTNDLRRGFTFDATKESVIEGLAEVKKEDYTDLGSNVFHLQYGVEAGGVIYATDDLQYALGVYGSTPGQGGSAKYFTLWKFGSFDSPSVTKWSAGNGWSTFKAGENRFTTYIVAGTLDQVRVAMRRLYVMGYR